MFYFLKLSIYRFVLLRFYMFLPDEYLFTLHTKPSGWTHIVINYLGPNNDKGISLFYDGIEEESYTDETGGPRSASNGRIVVGRLLTDQNVGYTSAEVDELIFFNQALNSDAIFSLYTDA